MAIQKVTRRSPLRDKDLDNFKLEDVIITYEYGPGYGCCAEQCSITIHGDGEYELIAKYEQPICKDYVSSKLVFYILTRLFDANFANLKDEYRGREWLEWDRHSGIVKKCVECSTDLSYSTIKLVIGNRYKTVYNYEGAPEELNELSDMFQKIINSLQPRYKRKPRRCPICGGHEILDIVYGEPSYETSQRAENGEFVLGGCCIDDNSPDWTCESCGADFRRKI